ncbi:hypothetical protein FC897_01070 [Clostridium botulinum]|nr:hypothetical protein [Clostridium botulinum]
MIQVFCDQRGSGKTKAMINMANEEVKFREGNIVYIDEDNSAMFQLNSEIMLIDSSEFKINSCESFYGFLCGILSKDYDIESVYIDGLFDIVTKSVCNAAQLFYALEDIGEQYNVNFFISINEEKDIPEIIRKYVA